MSAAARRPTGCAGGETDGVGPGFHGRGAVGGAGGASPWLGPSGWLLLAALLAATALAAATADRFGWPRPLADEATYAMQAESLAFDGDLAFEAADRDRFVARWRVPPEGLVLQQRGGAGRATFGRPFLYALLLAPWVWLAPVTGAQLANALWLALAALLAARTLGRSLGAVAPFWVAALCFASTAFGSVFRVEPGVFFLGAVAMAFSLAYGGERTRAPGDLYVSEGGLSGFGFAVCWLVVGVLLAVSAAS